MNKDIITFGPYCFKTVKEVGDTDEGLLYLDKIVDEVDNELKEVIKEYLAKNGNRLDAAIENKSKRYKKTSEPPNPYPAPWWKHENRT
jgi:hypothetical protein